MFRHMRHDWRQFADAPPGERFQRRYARRRDAHHGVVRKTFYLGVGSIAMLAGVVLMLIPGPGVVVFAIGAGIAAQQSLLVARSLDWLDVKIHAMIRYAAEWWRRASLAARMMLAALPLLAIGVIGIIIVVVLRGEL